jgi:hypothetical protein
VQFLDWCAPVKFSSSAEYSVLQALQFQEVSVRRIFQGGTRISHQNLLTAGSELYSLCSDRRENILSCVFLLQCYVVIAADHIENPAFHNSYIVACITVATMTWCLLCRNLVTRVFSDKLFHFSGIMSQYKHVQDFLSHTNIFYDFTQNIFRPR